MDSQGCHSAFPPPLDDGGDGAKLILSVDDDQALLHLREQILQCEGYRVLSARDGEDALTVFTACPVDLVLLDYSMPGIDGGVVAQEMKRRKPLVPVIMVSGHPAAIQSGASADCFIEKGQGSALLLQTIKTHLNK